ncbi:protein FAN-like [Gigantopelta aegis]|uniref:protein FAN-like n=1 Tax=Gigantopelta aegis TaxID=1735272 RepID=UPI001B88A6C7|nr:protein FAN-like [Gigantopelta aegis]
MAFLETDTLGQERFSLLLLEPGEIYFEDFSVFYYPCGLSEDDAIRKKQRGHLKMCSKSIVFVPKEVQFPILKFPMKCVETIDEWSGGLFSKLGVKGKVMKVVSEQAVEMKEKNIIAPFVFKRETAEYKFSLNYAALDDCLPLFCQLQRASTLPPADQLHMINAIVLSRQSRVKFNTSWLEDLYEEIVLESSGDRITPLLTNPGRIMLTSSRLYFQPFNNIDRWPVLKIRLKDIRRMIRRRFLLREQGLEIYCKPNAPVTHLYLSLKTVDARNELYDLILKQSEIDLDDSGQEDMTLQWLSGHISNFEYLMYLNSLADRSFNDLTQYPVLPWIISDYTSSELDLEDESVYRDLSKPIGALNPERLDRIKERFEDMPEPRFLYGSHYSTPGHILFYLARICPEYVLCLQNGKFDHPDRMFNNLQDTWQNCLKGAADFKELIPEFFQGNGDFLVHKGVINFGAKNDGKPVGSVELPPWASSPADFVGKLQQALESDHCSKHIHGWIDLIFGFKQRGPAAEEANNLFYYLTYEGAIDLDKISDPNERASLETQIMEFGQIPKQLFTIPHPQRFSSLPIPRSPVTVETPAPTEGSTDASTEEKLKDTHKTESPDVMAVSHYVKEADLSQLSVYLQHTLHKDAVTDVKISPDGKNIFSVSQDSLLKMYSLEEQRQLRSVNMSSMVLSSCFVMPDNTTIIVGSWDNSIYFYSIEYGRVLHTLVGHDDAVSDITWCNNMLYTASWDSTVKIWHLPQCKSGESFVPAEYFTQLDHDAGVTCLYLDSESRMLLTGTREGQLCIWDLTTFYMTSQHPVHHGRINAVLISPNLRRILSSGADNYIKVLDTVTGTEIFTKDVPAEILCLNWAGHLVVSGNSSGHIQIWDMDRGVSLHQITAHKDAVTSVHVGHNGTLLQVEINGELFFVVRPIIL